MLGVSKLAKLATGRYGALILVGFLAIQAYLLIRPSTPPLDAPRAEVADDVARQVADALGTLARDTWAAKYVRVARFEGDQNDQVRMRIEDELPARTNCRLVKDSMLAEIRDRLAQKAGRFGLVTAVTADNLQGQPVGSLRDAVELAQRRRFDYVVYGRVEDFRVELGRAYLRVTLEVADAAARNNVFSATYESGDGTIYASAPTDILRADTRLTALRLLGWLMFVVLLPIGTGWFWKNLLDRESNFVNVLCLLFLTAIDSLLAWALMGLWLGTVWLWLILLGGIFLSGSYNFFILNVLERSREEAKYAV